MRGRQDPQVTLLAFIDLETRVPSNHPLRVIKRLADQALKALSPDLDRMYANVGRPSIPPERLLKSSLLIALYSVRSERAFCEQLDYNLLFRWFLDMNLMEPSLDATTFTKNRERLLRHGVGQALFGEVVLEADRQGLLSNEHFTVDGTPIEAAASLKSFNPKDGDPPRTTDADPGNPSVDFHGERRGGGVHLKRWALLHSVADLHPPVAEGSLGAEEEAPRSGLSHSPRHVLRQIFTVELIHGLYDGLHELAGGGVVGVLGDRDNPDALAPEHGLEGDGVLSLPGEPRKLPDDDDLEGGLRMAALLDHLPELGPVGDAAAFGLVHVLAGHGVAVGPGVFLERPQLGGHAQVHVMPVAGHPGEQGRRCEGL